MENCDILRQDKKEPIIKSRFWQYQERECYSMNRNKKGLHKVTANVLSLTLASVMAAGAAGEAVSSVQVYAAEVSGAESAKTGTTVYLNGTLSQDSKGDGTTKEKAVSSIESALKLAGSRGTVLVCGPVTLSSEKTLSIPSGIEIRREQSYKGAIIKITGKGKLILSEGSLQAADVDTSQAELGKEAFVQGTKTQTKKEGQVSMASQVTIPSAEAWNSFDFAAAGFSGEGSFSWASQTAPAQYQSTVQVIFTPKDTETYDYSKVPGWDSSKNRVVRNVEVTIESLKPVQEEPSEEETVQPPKEPEEQPEKEEAGDQPDTSKPTEPTEPEGTEEEKEDTSQTDTEEDEDQTGEDLAAGQVTVPDKITLSSPEEAKNFDFTKAGFSGEGKFSWEKEFLPEAYESEVKVVFTPSDAEKKDYTQIEGWDEEKGQVICTVKVFVESLKKEENEEQNSQKPENTQENDDEQKPAEENGNGDKEQAQPEEDTVPEEPSGEKDPVKEEVQEETDEEETSSETETTETVEEEEFVQAQPGKTGEVAQEIPQAVPVGSLIDENTGVRVEGDFLPYYVDLQVSYNEDLDQLPDAGIGEILSAYEIKLWDLKEDKEYTIPEGKKVRVMIPLPENADSFSQLSIAHYLGNSEYEYYTLPTEEYPGTMAIIDIEGIQFLTFETASFSPFNVGGSQLVGPGIQISQSAGTSDKNTGSSGSSGTASGSSSGTGGNTQASPSKTSSGQSGVQPSRNSGASVNTGNPTGNAVRKNTPSRLIRVVKTGDNMPIALYGASGAAALLLGAAATIIGKKKRS